METIDDFHFKNQPEGNSKVVFYTYLSSLSILVIALANHITTYSITTYPPLSGPPTVSVSVLAVTTMMLFTPISTLLLVMIYLHRLRTLSTNWLVVLTLLHILVVGTVVSEIYHLIY